MNNSIIINQDIVNSPENEIIIHQVNCCNVMGAGVARAIYSRYPYVKTLYHKFCNYHFNNKIPLLGRFQICTDDSNKRVILNVFGQQNYGNDGKLYTDYMAIYTAFNNIALYYMDCDVTFAIPYGFGSGLAGGNFDIVRTIIETALSKYKIKYYKK